MLERLKRWWSFLRHLRALDDAGYVIIRREALEEHRRNVHELQRWVNESGALNDGTVPNHTKKTIAAHARTVRFWFPATVARDGVENGA